jgi:hypothetical protein
LPGPAGAPEERGRRSQAEESTVLDRGPNSFWEEEPKPEGCAARVGTQNAGRGNSPKHAPGRDGERRNMCARTQ